MGITDIIYNKLRGKITPDEQRQLDAWLAGSESHRKLYEDILAMDNIPEAYRTYKDIDVNHRWHEFKKAHNKKDGSAIIKWLRPIAAVAAVAVLVFGIYIWQRGTAVQPIAKVSTPVAVSNAVSQAIEKSEQTGRCEASVTIGGSRMKVSSRLSDSILTAFAHGEPVDCEINTEESKEFWMTLPDGTRIHLDGGTRIAYTSDFGRNSRTVYLHGTAFFYVAKNPDMAFTVKTDNGDIKEYGTEFNVEATSERTSVVLVSGSIGLIPKSGGERRLQPGYKGDMTNGEISVTACDVKPYIAWNEGRFSFTDCRLDVLFAVLDKWYGSVTKFDTPDLKAIKVTGTFDKYQDVGDITKAIELAGGVRITRNGDLITIQGKDK